MEKKTGPKTLMMWFEPDFPELCPVRHILAWFAISGIKSGAIFPSIEFLNNSIIGDKYFDGYVPFPKDKDDQVTKNESIPYQTYLNFVKNTCNEVIEQAVLSGVGVGLGSRKWGSHVGRKSGYLFSVWGGGADIDIMNSARHKSIKNAAKYKMDASMLLELAKSNDPADGSSMVMRTPKWRSLYSASSQLAVPINATNRPNYKPMNELALIFVKEKLELEKIDGSYHKRCRVIADKMLLYDSEKGKIINPATEIEAQLLEILKKAPQLSANIDNLRKLMVMNAVNSADADNDENIIGATASNSGDAATNNNNVDVANQNIEEGDVEMFDAQRDKQKRGGNKDFLKETAIPISKCLKFHFFDAKDKFLEKHEEKEGNFAHSKFIEKKCRGEEQQVQCRVNVKKPRKE